MCVLMPTSRNLGPKCTWRQPTERACMGGTTAGHSKKHKNRHQAITHTQLNETKQSMTHKDQRVQQQSAIETEGQKESGMGLTPLIPGQEVEAGRSVLKGSLVYRVPRRQSYTEKPCLTLPGKKRKMNAGMLTCVYHPSLGNQSLYWVLVLKLKHFTVND